MTRNELLGLIRVHEARLELLDGDDRPEAAVIRERSRTRIAELRAELADRYPNRGGDR